MSKAPFGSADNDEMSGGSGGCCYAATAAIIITTTHRYSMWGIHLSPHNIYMHERT
jgi:hypothetical protein